MNRLFFAGNKGNALIKPEVGILVKISFTYKNSISVYGIEHIGPNVSQNLTIFSLSENSSVNQMYKNNYVLNKL